MLLWAWHGQGSRTWRLWYTVCRSKDYIWLTWAMPICFSFLNIFHISKTKCKPRMWRTKLHRSLLLNVIESSRLVECIVTCFFQKHVAKIYIICILKVRHKAQHTGHEWRFLCIHVFKTYSLSPHVNQVQRLPRLSGKDKKKARDGFVVGLLNDITPQWSSLIVLQSCFRHACREDILMYIYI